MQNDKKLSNYNDVDLLEVLEEWFQDVSSAEYTWRDKAKVWYDYYNGIHWSSSEIEALEARGQAVSTYNHIAPAIDAIIGGERQNRPDVKMVGRTMDDHDVAEVKTKLYDYITYNSDTNTEEDKQIKDALITGRGWIYTSPQMNGKEFQDIVHEHIDWRDVFLDPLSRKDDLSDARHITHAIYTDADVIKQQFPEYDEESSDSETVFSFGGSSEDGMWFEKAKRRRPRLFTTWYTDEKGITNVVVWVKGKILYSKKNPYTKSGYPFNLTGYKRDLDNKPYGIVKAMISPQDEVNKRHSKALHYLNAKQVLAEEDAFVDWNEAEKTLAKPDGITKLRDGALSEGRMQIIDNVQLASTHIQMMELAKGQVANLAGINPAYLGQSSQYESGKKANQSISQAQNTLVPFLNKVRMSRFRLATFTMGLVPDFYTDERLIRITQPQGGYTFMQVNQLQQLPDGTIQKFNDLGNDDVDTIVEEAPSGLNDKVEQFNQLLTIQGQTQRPIPMEILLRYSDLKDKYQLAADLKSHYDMEAQLQQAQMQVEQMQQQIQQMGGHVQQVESQLVQSNVARAVDKEVSKAKGEIEKEKQAIKDTM